MQPNYLLNAGYDISILKLSRNSTKAPTQGRRRGGAALLGAPARSRTIVGFGITEEGGDTPDTLQKAQVPITTDAYCAGAYSDFDADLDGLRRATRRAAPTPARATPAARCSAASPPAR